MRTRPSPCPGRRRTRPPCEVAVDTAAATAFGPSGSTDVAVGCDDVPHAITITPRSDAGPGVPQTEEVESG